MTTTTHVHLPEKAKTPFAAKILTFAATQWLAVATVGQWLFGMYILLFYGKTTLTGHFDRWKDFLPDRYVDGMWKVVLGIHVLLAVIPVIGGPLQFIPAVRLRFPVFHRWIGRLYVGMAIVVSIAGLIMVWTRGTLVDPTQHISISIQAIYIILFAVLTLRYAIALKFTKHNAWALRLFMVVNGVWFFRVGLMFWLVVNGKPVGFDPETFTGPFLTILSIITYAVPLSLIMTELYLYALKKQNKALSLLTSALIFLCTIIMGIGIFGATMGLWLPRLDYVCEGISTNTLDFKLSLTSPD